MLMISLGPLSILAFLAGILGLSSARGEQLEGEAYYKEHLEGRFRSRSYALRHPVEAAKLALRRLR